MSNRSRAKGTRGENLAVAFLQEELGDQVERRVTQGQNDRGDISGIPGIVCEVKWCAEMDLGNWLKEAEIEAARAGNAFPVLMHNRRMAAPSHHYASMPWWVLRYFLRLHVEDVARRKGAA